MDTPDFRTHKEGWKLHAGFEAGLQSDSTLGPHAGLSVVIASEATQSTLPLPGEMDCVATLAMTGNKGVKQCLKKAC
ncbi:MAG: hypothetical protein ABJA75_08650 [Bradyrhizobium sp.]